MLDMMKKFRFAPKNPRRGIAIELAIEVMVIATVLGALLATFAMLKANVAKTGEAELERRIVLDEIGEAFCAEVLDGDDEAFNTVRWEETELDFAVVEVEPPDGEGLSSYTLTVSEGGASVFTVILEPLQDSSGYKITRWS